MLKFSAFLILQKNSKATELIERPNGYFITGAGCGGENPIRNMNYIPEDLKVGGTCKESKCLKGEKIGIRIQCF